MENQRVGLRVAGALSGCVYVESLNDTVSQLRREVGRLLDVENVSDIKLIVGGRQLLNDEKSLSEYRVTAASRILVTKGAASPGMSEPETRLRKLEKLKAVVESMASKDGRGLTDEYEFALENQDGARLRLDPEDRKAIVMGLALHAKGKSSMHKGNYEEAIGELQSAEESFGLCRADILGSVDNFALLLIDLVWCCYKLQDAGRLAVCRQRLERAQKLLAGAHGPNAERLRAIHGKFFPELTTYLRLDLLLGVVSFHMQDNKEAQEQLKKARQLWTWLQVSDQDLAMLQSMGYSMTEARRAMRFCGGDINQAVVMIAEARKKNQARMEQKVRHTEWRNERMDYGKTSSGVYVDLDELDKLVALGYERGLAAEALRSKDNDDGAALDALLEPASRSALELAVLTRVTPDEELEAVDGSHVSTLVGLGYTDAHARLALHSAGGDMSSACAILDAWGEAAHWGGNHLGQAAHQGGNSVGERTHEGGNNQNKADEGPSNESSRTARQRSHQKTDEPRQEPEDKESQALRKELRKEVNDDPLAAYDIDISEEGQVIQLYLSMLEDRLRA